uniref:EamA domain-containing protein n=1 Tax=Aegilops tauschii subsp. strangulata TaxID=200361 RepID=A0A453K2Y2_AEGTS
LIFSVLLLGKTYSLRQIIGCLLVTSGVILAVASGANDGHLLSGVKLIWPLLMVISSAFQAGASILKESVFVDGAKRLKGKRPDIFVVNSFGSGFQVLFLSSFFSHYFLI